MATYIWVNIGLGNDLLPSHYLKHCWINILWHLNLGGIFLKERLWIASIWVMEVKSSQSNLKTIREEKIE